MRQFFLLLFITQIFLQQKHNQRSINVLWTEKIAFVSFWLIERNYHCVLKLICMINIFVFASNDCSVEELCVRLGMFRNYPKKIIIQKKYSKYQRIHNKRHLSLYATHIHSLITNFCIEKWLCNNLISKGVTFQFNFIQKINYSPFYTNDNPRVF